MKLKVLFAGLALVLALPAGAQSLANVRLEPPELSAGQKTTGTVYLSAAAPTGGATVTLSVTGSGVTVPASVVVGAGTASKTFTLSSTTSAYGRFTVTATLGTIKRRTYAYVSDPGFSQGWVEMASLTSTGSQGNGNSGEAWKYFDGDSRKLSGDGRYSVFTSKATNLVTNDRNRKLDVFLRDRTMGTTVRVSELPTGVDGNGDSYQPCISADGNYVAFVTDATNLSTGDTNGQADVILYSRLTKALTRVSVAANDGSYTPTISGDGRYIAYASYASNLSTGDLSGWSDIFVFDRTNSTNKRVSLATIGEANGDSFNPSISADGRYVAFESGADNLITGDGNEASDIFVRDTTSATNTRVSLGMVGQELQGFSFSPSISGNGKVVTFATYAALEIDEDGWDSNPASKILIRDLDANSTTVIDTFYDSTYEGVDPVISASGRFVAYTLISQNPSFPARVNAYDRLRGHGFREDGDDLPAWDPSLSNDGRWASVATSVRDLVPGDANGRDDVFVFDAVPQAPFAFTDALGIQGDFEILGGDSVPVQIHLTQAAKTGGQVVNLSTTSATQAGVPATVTVPAGALSATFTVKTGATTVAQFPTIGAAVNSRFLPQDIRVVPAQLVFTPAIVPVGATSVSVKFRVSKTSTSARTFSVSMPMTSGFTYPATIVLPANASSVNFNISFPADSFTTYYVVEVTLGSLSGIGSFRIGNP